MEIWEYANVVSVLTPLTNTVVEGLSVGDAIRISGAIFTGRDAVLPKIASLIDSDNLNGIELQGAVIFHTAVSPAGIGPTSSNKLDIEPNIPLLSKAGVKIHLGKGAISESTVKALRDYNSLYAVVPPVSALLISKIKTQEVVAFHKEGIEAFHRLEVVNFPAIIAAAHGKSVYSK